MLALLAVALILSLATTSYLTRLLGHRISLTSLGFFYIHGFSYKTSLVTITISKFDFKPKFPSRLDPSWAVITISDYEYKDSACHVSMDSCLTKLWFFPVLHRFSFSPWVDATIEGFAMHVYKSDHTPPLLQDTRRHLMVSTLNGDTVRLGRMNTRIFFGRNAEVPVPTGGMEEKERGMEDLKKEFDQRQVLSKEIRGDAEQNGVEMPSFELNGTTNHERKRTTSSERDDVRVRVLLEQWHMVTLNHRMYAFGEIQGELRRSWLDDRGSVVVIMKDIAWVKLPPNTDEPLGNGRGKLWEIARAIWYFPSTLFTLARDPVAFADIHVERFDVTFLNFRLRDAELLKQGAIRLKQEHLKFERRHPGVLSDFAWDMFVHGLQNLCKE